MFPVECQDVNVQLFTCSSSRPDFCLFGIDVDWTRHYSFLTPLLYGTLVRPFQQIMYQQSLSFRVLGSAKTWFQDHGRAIDHQQISGDIVPRGYDVRIWLFRGSSPKQHVRNPQIVARSAKEIYWNESNLGQVQGLHA